MTPFFVFVFVFYVDAHTASLLHTEIKPQGSKENQGNALNDVERIFRKKYHLTIFIAD